MSYVVIVHKYQTPEDMASFEVEDYQVHGPFQTEEKATAFANKVTDEFMAHSFDEPVLARAEISMCLPQKVDLALSFGKGEL